MKTAINMAGEWPGAEASLPARRRNQPRQHCTFRLLASRTVRRYTPVVKSISFIILCYSSPNKPPHSQRKHKLWLQRPPWISSAPRDLWSYFILIESTTEDFLILAHTFFQHCLKGLCQNALHNVCAHLWPNVTVKHWRKGSRVARLGL